MQGKSILIWYIAGASQVLLPGAEIELDLSPTVPQSLLWILYRNVWGQVSLNDMIWTPLIAI